MADAEREIRNLVAQLARAWRDGESGVLRALLQPHVPLVPPEFSVRAAVEDDDAFMQNAQVLDYRGADLAIDVDDAGAVATYRYEMTWELGGERHQERGHDVLVLSRDEAQWRVAWRTLVPQAA